MCSYTALLQQRTPNAHVAAAAAARRSRMAAEMRFFLPVRNSFPNQIVVFPCLGLLFCRCLDLSVGAWVSLDLGFGGVPASAILWLGYVTQVVCFVEG